MLHGMFVATKMLQSYGELGWIRHPDASSALVVASLQREAKIEKDSSGKARGDATKIRKVEEDVKTISDQIKDLFRNNPTLKK